MTINMIDSIIYFIFAITIFTIQFGSIGFLYGTVIGLFLGWFRYNHY
jgi:hypothetical protein